MHFDLKPAAVYIGSIFLGDVNQSLQAVGLLVNIFYVAFQYTLKKKKANEKPNN